MSQLQPLERESEMSKLSTEFVNIRVPKSMAEALMDAEDDVTTVSIVKPTAPPPPKKSLPPIKVGKIKWVEPEWAPDLHYALTAPKHHKLGGAMLFGPRGTGKSMAVEQISARLKLKSVGLGCCKGMMYNDLVGTFDFDEKTRFVDGPLTEAVRNDCIFYAEEANNIPPGQWALLNPLLDGSGLPLVLPNGERLKVGPNFKTVLCYNPDYAGTMEINESLKDRLYGIDTVYMEPDDERDALMANVPELSCDIATGMIAIANGIRAAAAEFGFDLSIRSLMQWANVCFSDITQYSWEKGFKKVICGKMGTAQENGEVHRAVAAIAESMGYQQWESPQESNVLLKADDEESDTPS